MNEFEDNPFDLVSFARKYAKTDELEEAKDVALRSAEKNRAIQHLDAYGGSAASGQDAEELLNAGMRAVEAAAQGKVPQAGSIENAGLEAVVRLIERPALLVLHDNLGEPPPPRWKSLSSTQHLVNICKRLPKVGRISIKKGGKKQQKGTGFVVAPGVIVTNRHVLETFGEVSFGEPTADGDPSGVWRQWDIAKHLEPVIDFKAEHASTQKREFRITRVLGCPLKRTSGGPAHLDIAFLEVEPHSIDQGKYKLPPLVELSGIPPEPEVNSEVYCIGYPAVDNEPLPREPAERAKVERAMREIFGEKYGVKRLQPGEFGALDQNGLPVFSHDCSTLGGSSGSCLVDIGKNVVTGLHFMGRRGRANYALAWWLLQDDIFITQKVGATFYTGKANPV